MTFPSLRWKPNSLFFKIFLYFLGVILLLASYNIWSLSFYTRNIQQETIKYNQTILRDMTEAFETQFRSWKGLLLNLAYDDRFRMLQRQAAAGGKPELNYLLMNEMLLEIRGNVYNPFYAFDNLLLYFRPEGQPYFVLEKDGIVDTDRMFNRFYPNDRYPQSFWDELEPSSALTVYPSTRFGPQGGRLLLPIVAKLSVSSSYTAAFVDLDKWFQAYRGTPDSQFWLLGPDRTVLFQSKGATDASALPSSGGTEQWQLKGDTYYFYERGAESGLTYVTVIPDRAMNLKVREMTWLAVLLFVITILAGLFASFLFSRNIDRPLKRILAGLRKEEPDEYRSTIAEFDDIHRMLRDLKAERLEADEQLRSSRSLLTNYEYMTRFKRISADRRKNRDWLIAEGAFTLVCFSVRFRESAMERMNVGAEEMAVHIREVIHLYISKAFSVSHTFQMESDQFLSVVYSSSCAEELKKCLGKLKLLFDHDHPFYLVTVAVSPLFAETGDFDRAYEETLQLIHQAKPLEETQIIWEREPLDEDFQFDAEEEHAFYVHLQAGNISACRTLLTRKFERLEEGSASAAQLGLFVDSVVRKTRKTLELLKLDWPAAEREREPFADCITTDQYRQELVGLLEEAAGAIRRKREESYEIVDFLLSFLETHCHEDISLELLADKLNMSPTYLSGYIKDKTGRNFSDHLSEIRLAKAKQLLEETDLTVQEVGQRVGYRNGTSFIRMFKKSTGVPPGDYRKSVIRKREA
ncbi:hypothetical protein J31TS4_33860 [Paenibacillus sp. J31TS4]|uniref:helix-turn-helix domain-containing protein n=1 Tax=Paenibacillus sp. J31TS4 TaxID=2807195 RepID=UPI001AFF95E9|nr:AraC family transcriptional regulator [Paenibacillus sp. J31TS4]GIP40106.1 hypothetical protein J31TS4_33860 [Paenibacillus sp. J31TS4]